ncbi:rhomboid family intramembrane serine protease [Haloarculaceae archaeon H-GB1-1]|nr:rhomboid family intramembrane serine protease [Haloarculaceae archaeon H-GB1-1]
MSKCDACGKPDNMPYQCRHCGGTYCSEHRLPENHDCPGLENWDDPGGVFDSGFDDSVQNSGGRSASLRDRLSLGTGTGSVWGYFRGNMTYVFLGAMWVTFLLQHVVGQLVGYRSALWESLFVLSPQHPLYVWTWFTSVFAHQPFFFWHIVGNSIVIFFFGRIVEQYVGSKQFTALFLASGALAGLGQIVIQMLGGGGLGVLGASGAGLAIMGVLTVLNPDLRVYIWFILPVPIWALTAFYLLISIGGAFGIQTGFGMGNVADVAHLVGLLIGLAYGKRVKGKRRAPQQLQFGAGRGPGGPGGPGRGKF